MTSRMLWVAFGLFVLAAMIVAATIGFTLGCKASSPAHVEAASVTQDAASCRAKISRIIQAPNLTCPEQVAKIRALGHEDPACLEVYLGKDINLTCKGDGGTP